MYARVVHIAGAAEDIDRVIAAYREQVLPYAREVTGFRGHTILVDRGAGRGISITLWTTEEAMLDFEPAAQRFRSLLSETWGTLVRSMETYEVGLFELSG